MKLISTNIRHATISAFFVASGCTFIAPIEPAPGIVLGDFKIDPSSEFEYKIKWPHAQRTFIAISINPGKWGKCENIEQQVADNTSITVTIKDDSDITLLNNNYYLSDWVWLYRLSHGQKQSWDVYSDCVAYPRNINLTQDASRLYTLRIHVNSASSMPPRDHAAKAILLTPTGTP